VSWFGRKHGLACSSMVAAEVVTADGVVRRVDAEHDPELFWALRDGGGGFAVVTALELRLHGVKQDYDPDDLLRSNHPLVPTNRSSPATPG
jgi:FAD/FMN-containing dehydrogenase